jgi:parallel beta-helix repeat protein
LKTSIVLLIGLILLIPLSSGTILEDTSRGDILYVGGSGPGNYTKIQDAIDNASTGDTVFVYEGMYTEGIFINKTINLLGEYNESTIIDSTNISDISILISKYADGTQVSDFTIKNDEIDRYAVSVYLISDFNIITNNIMVNRGCIIIEDIGGGVVSSGNTISNNILTAWHYAVIIESSENNVLSDNYISHNDCHAVYVKESEHNLIFRNHIVDNYYGILLSESASNNQVVGNIVTGNAETGIASWRNIGNIILDNIVTDNKDGGIILMESINHTVNHNHIENNGYIGIGAFDSVKNRFSENNFFNNERDAKYVNILYHFLPTFRNRWDGNYWGAPRNLPKPIFGWVYLGFAYLPIGFPRFQYDWLPAQEPYDI